MTQNSRKRKVTIATPEEVPQKKKKRKKKKNKDDVNVETTPVTNVPAKQQVNIIWFHYYYYSCNRITKEHY